MSPELTGALIALLVPVCFGTGSVLVRVGLVEIPSNTGNFISLVSGWIVMVTVALVLFPSDLVSVTFVGLAGLALIGFINFPIGRFLNFMSIQRLGVVRANLSSRRPPSSPHSKASSSSAKISTGSWAWGQCSP